jgi:ubiquinone/menaquinone biosynthesis C-methylase UbiE
VSISFDRAADYYDATRSLPPDQSDAVADLLAAELRGRGRSLEIGVGTGRIARPLVERSIDLVGIDLAPAMLTRLVDNAGGRAPLPLAVADATALPFKDASYDAVLASHVFHLIPDWQQAADEAIRVLRPGGALLVDFGGGVDSPWRDAIDEACRANGVERVRPGVSHAEELAAYYGDRTQLRRLEALHVPVSRTRRRDIEDLENQIYSWTWSYPAEQIKAVADHLRERARRDGLDLDEPGAVDYLLQWWAFDVPA